MLCSVFAFLSLARTLLGANYSEPWPWIHGYQTNGTASPWSPDPLVRYTWSPSVDPRILQIYPAKPTKVQVLRGNVIVDEEPLRLKISGDIGEVLILFEFGPERAAWVEFDSADLTDDQLKHVTMSISEYDTPWTPGKTLRPVKYERDGYATYRLETNKELYEGVRFAWFNWIPAAGGHFTISKLELICQVKPVNYTGSFSTSDNEINKIWNTGAYSSRLNMNTNYFTSILIDRGDRVAIQGDGFPTMAAALAGFANKIVYDLVFEQLNSTDSSNHKVIDSGIMAYPLYWTLSVADLYWVSGNASLFKHFIPSISEILQQPILTFNKNPNIVWMGWDDRLGNGWCGKCQTEAQMSFKGLVIRACREFATALRDIGNSAMADQYDDTADIFTTWMRQASSNGDPWYHSMGIHALAYAVNAGVATEEELPKIHSLRFNNSISVCSWSPFNQYFILEALGKMDMDYALASIKLCWGNMVKLGEGCFWELFSPEWARWMSPGDKAPTRPSYCHPWSNGVTYWLSREMGGIRPLRSGGAQWAVAPRFTKTIDQVNATRQLGPGQVKVRASRTLERGELHVVISVESTYGVGTVGVDESFEGYLKGPRVFVDGNELGHLNKEPLTGYDNKERNLRKLLWTPSILLPGRHTVKAVYKVCQGCRSVRSSPRAVLGGDPLDVPPFPTPVYPSTTAPLDYDTKGNWIGKYGSLGYILYGYNSDASDLSSIPDWADIAFLSGHSPGKNVFNGTGNYNRYLQNPNDLSQRALGSNYLKDSDGSQGIVLDVTVTPDAPAYTLSLYLVADDPSTVNAIRVMDLLRLNVFAKDQRIKSFENGVYWSVKVQQKVSIRVRYMGIYGCLRLAAAFLD